MNSTSHKINVISNNYNFVIGSFTILPNSYNPYKFLQLKNIHTNFPTSLNNTDIYTSTNTNQAHAP